MNVKKIKKLIRDPKLFMEDSEIPLIRGLGNLIYSEEECVNIVGSALNVGVEIEKNDLKFSFTSSDVLWPELGKRVGLILTGIKIVDLYRREYLQRHCIEVVELKLFDDELDDFEFRMRKKAEELILTQSRLLELVDEHSLSTVVFPYDSTPGMSALVASTRSIGVTTLNYVVCTEPCMACYKKYGEKFIADYVLIGNESIQNLPPKMLSEELFYDEEESNWAGTSDRDELLFSRLGISPANEVIFLIAPPLQLESSAEEIESSIDNLVEQLSARLQPNQHLVVLRKRKKGGFVEKALNNRLKQFHRKSNIFFDQLQDVRGMLGHSIVVAPLGFPMPMHSNYVSFYSSVSGKHVPEAKLDIRVHNNKESFRLAPYLSTSDIAISQVMQNKIRKVAVPDPVDNKVITDGRQKYLPELLGFSQRVYGADPVENVIDSSIFLQWGAEPNEPKMRPEKNRCLLGRPKLFLEDGFIRSLDLWTDPNVPTLSVVMDSRAIYYDAGTESLLERVLNSTFELSDDELDRSRKAMKRIVDNRISKYNYAPKITLPVRPGRKNVLLVDQKAGDMSIKYGGADASTFEYMLHEALELENTDVYIKLHPIAIKEGGDAAHYTYERLGSIADKENVFLIGFDINPYSLIEPMDEVWVVSSGMGFEALMAQKKVRCFGVPFYSSWGITTDYKPLVRRNKVRSIEDIFFVFYVLLSRYVDPIEHSLCEIEELLDYFERVLTAREVNIEKALVV